MWSKAGRKQKKEGKSKCFSCLFFPWIGQDDDEEECPLEWGWKNILGLEKKKGKIGRMTVAPPFPHMYIQRQKTTFWREISFSFLQQSFPHENPKKERKKRKIVISFFTIYFFLAALTRADFPLPPSYEIPVKNFIVPHSGLIGRCGYMAGRRFGSDLYPSPPPTLPFFLGGGWGL